MFGLKVVNKKAYSELQDELSWYKRVATEKDTQIINLEGELKGLRSEVSRLEKKVKSLETPKKETNDVVLLTDVTETPLEVETKPKRTRVTKKTTTSKKKTVVHKVNE
jgi:predicted  nucleic acid-binding Zn-ribbon protein